MFYIAADALLILHLLWVLFMIVGFPLALILRSPGLRLIHALGLVSYLLLAALNWYCPLTEWETALRRMDDPAFSYHGSFLAAWAEKIIYVQNWGASVRLFQLLAALYLVLIGSSFFWWGKPQTPHKSDSISPL